MKVVKKISEYRIWQQIQIDDMHIQFMEKKGTTDANFIVRQMQKNFKAKGKLYFGIVICRDQLNSRFHGRDISVKLAFFREKCLVP